MTRSVHFAYPGDLETRTGGYGYDRQIVSELRKSGWQVSLVPLGAGFPFPDDATLQKAEETLGGLAEGALVLIDGLAYGAFSKIAARLSAKLKIIALVHHPLASEGNMPEQQQIALADSEREALAYAKTVLVTSSATRQQLVSDYGVTEDRIIVAIPGTERGIRSRRNSKIPRISSIGSVIPRKGHDVLIAALSTITDLSWECSIVGNRTMDVDYDAALQKQISDSGLEDRIRLVGQVDNTRLELASADIFALASRYEGYGMVFAEALSHGLPIIACRAGAIPEVVPVDAGILVPPDDPAAFGDALRRVLEDKELANQLADASFHHSKLLPQWADTAKLFATALTKAADERI
ncbi:glycosyltransferase family 4 protein [Phyllobacterium sp. K27]